MAPLLFHTGVDALWQTSKREVEKREENGGLGTASIVGIVIFVVFSVGFIASITAYCIHKRRERNKLPPEKRPTSYRPYRSNSGLLSNAADPSEDEKSSMFSRERGSSVSIYVDPGSVDRRASMESLIPLHITSAEDVHNSTDEASYGSGVSGISSRYSETTSGSLGVRAIPIPESAGSDLGTRPATGRARSTSTASMRYYEQNAIDPTPQIPKIVHTMSD